MRTTKRFTPSVLRRFERFGRGKGIFGDFIPWHRVGRGDPASRGRSHLRNLLELQYELLSDAELGCLFFIAMLLDVLDIREQFPLSLVATPHELTPYTVMSHDGFPGTLAIAKHLGIRHPRINGDGISEWWRMSTDFLLTLRKPGERPTLLAISCKKAEELKTRRTRDLLRVERAYWLARDVEWLLITEDQFDPSALDTLARTSGWALERPVGQAAMRLARDQLYALPDCPCDVFTKHIGRLLDNEEMAKRALWQGVWSGIIPVDLRRGWRPHLPLRLLSPSAFLALNPVASRRSAWD